MSHLARPGRRILAPVMCLLLFSPSLAQSRIEKVPNKEDQPALSVNRPDDVATPPGRENRTPDEKVNARPETTYYRIPGAKTSGLGSGNGSDEVEKSSLPLITSNDPRSEINSVAGPGSAGTNSPIAETWQTLPSPETLAAFTEQIGRNAVALNNLAVELSRVARFEEAAELLNRAIRTSPGVAMFHRNLSVVYESMKRMDEALMAARTAVDLAPRQPASLRQLCGLELIIGHGAEAVGCYESLAEVTSLGFRGQTFYGVALFKSGRTDDGIRVLEEAAAAAPDNADPVGALGMAYYYKKRYVDAASSLKRAVELAPNRGELRYNLAIAHLANGNTEGAISQYRILKLDSPKIAAKLYLVLYRDKLIFAGEARR